MKIVVDNVDVRTPTAGGATFASQLMAQFRSSGHDVIDFTSIVRGREHATVDTFTGVDVHLAFIHATMRFEGARVPLVQRLDGVYYNTDERFGLWTEMNRPIFATYQDASAVVFQSQFSRELVTSMFGEFDGPTAVITNGVDVAHVRSIDPIDDVKLVALTGCADVDTFDEVWLSCSTWRPHKRLSENVRYFLEHAPETACMIVVGDCAHCGRVPRKSDRVFYVGPVSDRSTLISLYRRASTFVHLAWHDNCPNVVVDANAAGCHVVVAEHAGSKYVAGPDATVIVEPTPPVQPCRLYEPPALDFTRKRTCGIECDIDIRTVATRYLEFMGSVVSS